MGAPCFIRIPNFFIARGAPIAPQNRRNGVRGVVVPIFIGWGIGEGELVVRNGI